MNFLKNKKKINELENQLKNLEYQCDYERKEKCKYKEKCKELNEIIEKYEKNRKKGDKK